MGTGAAGQGRLVAPVPVFPKAPKVAASQRVFQGPAPTLRPSLPLAEILRGSSHRVKVLQVGPLKVRGGVALSASTEAVGIGYPGRYPGAKPGNGGKTGVF